MRKRLVVFAAFLWLVEGCGTVGKPCVPASGGVAVSPLATMIGPFSKGDAAHHQAWIQEKLNGMGDARRLVVFAPGDYVLTDPAGVRVPGGVTLVMEGARFVLAADMATDGQAFLVEDVSHVTLRGGEIVGRRDVWDPGVNIAGVRVLGKVANVSVADLKCEDLSSNAVGMFGQGDEMPIRDVTLTHVVSVNCCNYYGDYLNATQVPLGAATARTRARWRSTSWTDGLWTAAALNGRSRMGRTSITAVTAGS